MLTRDLSRQTMQWIGGITLLGWLLLAVILLTGFIEPSGGGSGSSTTTLQQAFNNGSTATYGDCSSTKKCGYTGNSGAESLTWHWDASDGWTMTSSTAGGLTGPVSAQTPNAKTATYTVGTDDADECYGGLIVVTTAATIIACDNLAVGMNFSVYNIGVIAVSLDVQADDRMRLDGVALDDGDKATNTSNAGDMITCWRESASGWDCMSNGWTDGGA